MIYTWLFLGLVTRLILVVSRLGLWIVNTKQPQRQSNAALVRLQYLLFNL